MCLYVYAYVELPHIRLDELRQISCRVLFIWYVRWFWICVYLCITCSCCVLLWMYEGQTSYWVVMLLHVYLAMCIFLHINAKYMIIDNKSKLTSLYMCVLAHTCIRAYACIHVKCGMHACLKHWPKRTISYIYIYVCTYTLCVYVRADTSLTYHMHTCWNIYPNSQCHTSTDGW